MPELHPASCLVCWELLLLWASTQRSGGSVTMQLGGAQLWLRKGWWLHLPILKLYLKVGEATKGCCYCFWIFFLANWDFFLSQLMAWKKMGWRLMEVQKHWFPQLDSHSSLCSTLKLKCVGKWFLLMENKETRLVLWQRWVSQIFTITLPVCVNVACFGNRFLQ